jgi:hypothetical protein
MKTSHTLKTSDDQLALTIRHTADRASRSMYNNDDDEARYCRYEAELYELPIVGTEYMVAISSYVGPNGDRLPRLRFAPDNGEGWPGNSNPSVKSYHGWRGTTDDWSFHGYGVRTCLRADVTGGRSQKVIIIFGKDTKGAGI